MAEIRGTLKGDIAVKRVSYYASENSRIGVVSVNTRFDEEQAEKVLGELGKRVLFAAWGTNGEGDDAPLYKSLMPALVFEEHTVELLGWKGRCTPELGALKPVKGEHKVDVEILLPLPAADTMREFYGRLCTQVGATEKIKFAKTNLKLPGVAEDPKVIKKPGPHGSRVAKTVPAEEG